MPSLQNVRRRIKSVKSIQQITKAMDMVATSRMRHAKEAAIANHPYAGKAQEVFDSIAVQAEDMGHPLFEDRGNDEGRTLLIVIAADKGLAGAYSSNVFKAAHAEIDEDKKSEGNIPEDLSTLKDLRRRPRHTNLKKVSRVMTATHRSNMMRSSSTYRSGVKTSKPTEEIVELQDKGNVDVLTVGRKATDHFRHRNYNVVRYYNGISERPKYQDAQDIARFLIERYESGEVNEVEMVYTRFVSAINFVPEVISLLPFLPEESSADSESGGLKGEYIYEPDAGSVLSDLLPQYLVTVIYEAMLQSAASELSSRMNAMSNATDNAQELIAKLNLFYNKVRQAGITNEINEIVGGANALN